MKTWIKENQPTIFFVFACGISWLIWFPLMMEGLGWADFGTPKWVHLLGAFGPMLSALIVTGISLGRTELGELIRRMFDPSAGWKWITFALFSTPALFILGMVILRIHNAAWTDWAQFGYISELPELGWLSVWLVQISTFGFGEETGW